MADQRKEDEVQGADASSVFAYLHSDKNAAIAIHVAEIDKTTQAIRELEEITRQLDTPYIGSFFSS
jgi:hypothetical protein